MLDVRQITAYIIVVVVSVGASTITARTAANNTEELEARISMKVSVALQKVNEDRIAALQKVNEDRIAAIEIVCVRDSKTTKSSIKVRNNQAKNNKASGNDRDSKDTNRERKALRGQAKIEKESAERLEELRCKPKG